MARRPGNRGPLNQLRIPQFIVGAVNNQGKHIQELVRVVWVHFWADQFALVREIDGTFFGVVNAHDCHANMVTVTQPTRKNFVPKTLLTGA